MRLADIRAALTAHGRGVVAVVTRAAGSAPQDAGAVMVVTPGGTAGTLGGGAVEHRALGIAADMLSGRAGARAEVDFPLGPALDQCCGGSMRVALAVVDVGDCAGDPIELWPGGPVVPDALPGRPVLVYGAGHVGRAVVAALAPLEYGLTWVDTQAGRMADAPPGVDVVETPLPEAVAGRAPANAAHLVMTHSHAVDLEIVAAVLAKPHAHCGLIGSATKRALFERRLRGRGIPDGAIRRLICPIGLPGLRDKRPAAIAASVAAEMLLLEAGVAAAREAAP